VQVTTDDIEAGVSNLTIGSLQPNSNYTVNVLANTKSGKGDAIEKNITTYPPGIISLFTFLLEIHIVLISFVWENICAYNYTRFYVDVFPFATK
jgi:hypothetical protein